MVRSNIGGREKCPCSSVMVSSCFSPSRSALRTTRALATGSPSNVITPEIPENKHTLPASVKLMPNTPLAIIESDNTTICKIRELLTLPPRRKCIGIRIPGRLLTRLTDERACIVCQDGGKDKSDLVKNVIFFTAEGWRKLM